MLLILKKNQFILIIVFYDGRYVAEIKRLTEEYQHLRLKGEKEDMVNANKIESK